MKPSLIQKKKDNCNDLPCGFCFLIQNVSNNCFIQALNLVSIRGGKYFSLCGTAIRN